jgi:hypothetical protein
LTIDIRRLSLGHNLQPFPLCADCVPLELVVSAALLLRKNCGGEGKISVSGHHNVNEDAVYFTVQYMKAQVEALYDPSTP